MRKKMKKIRLSERVPFRRRIKFGSSKTTFTGYTSDLSEGGMQIKAKVGMAPNSRVVAKLYCDDHSITIEGTIVWVSQDSKGLSSAMGVKFSSRTDEIKQIYQTKLSQFKDAAARYQGSPITH